MRCLRPMERCTARSGQANKQGRSQPRSRAWYQHGRPHCRNTCGRHRGCRHQAGPLRPYEWVDPETADSAVEQVLSACKDCVRMVGRDLLGEVKCLMASKSAGRVMYNDANTTWKCEALSKPISQKKAITRRRNPDTRSRSSRRVDLSVPQLQQGPRAPSGRGVL